MAKITGTKQCIQ